MSFDLFPNEQLQTLERAAKNPSLEPQPGIFHNFLSGTGTTAMMGAAQVARAVDIAGAVGPIIMDKLSGGTTEQDKYFQEHDAVFNRAVDYWTPGPGEVGAAGKAVGSLLSIIPQFVISPGLAVATTGLSTAEDLTRQGIDVDKAIKAGMVQGTGLGLGMWLPIFGKSWATKALAAGAAGNIAQGIATTMATRQVLKGTPAEAQFNPWDMESIVINGLMGLAFGTIAHVTAAPDVNIKLTSDMTPEQRATELAKASARLTPADKDAIVAANAAMHVEHTTAPGRPVDDGSMTAHATAINKAIDDLLNGKTPDVEEALGPAAVREAPQGDHIAGAGNPIADLTTVPRAFQPRAIGDAVRARLRETGVDAEEAQANGAIWESFFRTAGERYGVAPADLLQQYGVDIKRLTTGDQLLGALDQTPRRVDINTAPFRAFFEGSQVVDPAGNPLPVYHYTGADFDTFKPGKYGPGIWFTGRRHEPPTRFSERTTREVEVYLSIKKPYVTKNQYDVEEGPNDPEFMAKLRKGGYDGIIYTDPSDPQRSEPGAKDMSQYVVFTPEQIKSATGNRGTFDPRDPNILFQSTEPFYSELARKIEEAKLPQAPAKGWKDYIKGLIQKGVKPDEIEATGINEWLDMQEGRVTKAQVQEFLKGNGVQVREVMLGEKGTPSLSAPEIAVDRTLIERAGFEIVQNPDDPNYIAFMDNNEGGDIVSGSEILKFSEADEALTEVARAAIRVENYWFSGPRNESTMTKFSTWQLPGGENYRELLFTLPKMGDGKTRAELMNERNIVAQEYEDAIERARLSAAAESGTPEGQRLMAEVERLRAEKEAEMQRLLGLPGARNPNFTESHFDQPNVLAHVRFNERTDADGKRVLFVEEFQSDWAQKGRERGFADATHNFKVEEGDNGAWLVVDQGDGRNVNYGTTREEAQRWADAHETQTSGIPKAPFVGKTEAWVALSMRRMIRYAAEHGFDRIAWTRGEQQVDRYTSALRSKVDYIEWEKTDKGVQLVGFKTSGAPVGRAIDDGAGGVVQRTDRTRDTTATKVVDTTEREDALSDAIGKAMADQIKQSTERTGTIEGDNLKIDSTGMANFYDRIVPNIANKIIAKLGGGRVATVEIPKLEPTTVYDRNGRIVQATAPRGFQAQHGFDITPAMREKALAGLPLFQEGARGQIQFGDGQTVIGLFESANKSTFLHESGHFFLQVTRDLATKPGAPEGAMQDWSTLADWLKIEGGEIPREAHEQFARGFEAYVAEGRAPNEQLRTVFQQFRDWLLRVYENIANLGAELTDPVRRVMDRMLESQREDPAPRAAEAEADAPPWARFDDDPQKEIDQQQVQASLHTQAAEVVQEQIAVEAPTPRLLVPPIPEDHQLPPALALRLQDQEVRSELALMAKDAGWATIGGRLQDRSKIGTPSFTAWIPNAEWWLRRPDRMSEGKVREAVRKALAGEKLKPVEERTVDFMLGEIEQMMGPPLQTGEQAPRAREDGTLQNRDEQAPFTPEDYAAAGIDRLRGSDAELAIRLADEMHGEVGGDWSKMTEAQKNAELDALFGPSKTTAESSAGSAGGARAGSSARPPEGTAGPGEPPAASAAREIASRTTRASTEPIEPLPPKARKAKKAAKDGEPAPSAEKDQVVPKKAPLGDTAAAAPDPIFETAARYIEANPDLALKLDQADGSTKTVKLKDELERTREGVARANEDAKLFAVAAECLIGAT